MTTEQARRRRGRLRALLPPWKAPQCLAEIIGAFLFGVALGAFAHMMLTAP